MLLLFSGNNASAVAQNEYKAKSTLVDCPNYWQIECHTGKTIAQVEKEGNSLRCDICHPKKLNYFREGDNKKGPCSLIN